MVMKGIGSPPAILKPTGRLYLNTEQSNIPTGTQTLVNLDTIDSDFTDGIEDTVNHKITPGVAGFYLIVASVYWSVTVSGKDYYAYIKRSGSYTAAFAKSQADHTGEVSNVVATIDYLSDSDYIELTVGHNAGVDTPDIKAGLQYTSLALQRLR